MRRNRFPALLLVILLCLTACSTAPEPFPALSPDLVVYTCQDESVYAPIIKEFQERTGWIVQLKTGSYAELEQLLQTDELPQTCDVVFGVNAATLSHYRSQWQPSAADSAAMLGDGFYDPDFYWIGFSPLLPVILYNTKVVTYRELPESWYSLLEPRWQGRIAFVDPTLSSLYTTALTSAMYSAEDPGQYLAQFAQNLNYQTLTSAQEVCDAVADGRCSIGICLEEDAELLRRENVDIDYIHPSEGALLVPDGSAIVKGCSHPDAAAVFLDFTVDRDTQNTLVSLLNRRSVRSDILPPAGLTTLERLPLRPMAPGEIYRLHSQALAQWQQLMSGQAGGESK